jgi:hypothetical protein
MIFHSYVKLPEGNPLINSLVSTVTHWKILTFLQWNGLSYRVLMFPNKKNQLPKMISQNDSDFDFSQF